MVNDKRLRRKTKTLLLSSRFWWALVLLFILSRVATVFFPYDSDHWIFYYVGKHWFDGGTLYLSAWDHKAPLIFAINGVMSMLFGDNIILHRIFFTLISVLSIWLFYISSKRLLAYIGIRNIESSSRIATAIFIFWSNLSQFTNSGNTTENFGVLFLLIALYCYLRFRENNLWKWLLYSGAAISLLIFLKINFSILVLPLVVDFIINYIRNKKLFLAYGLVWIFPSLAQIFYWYSYFNNRGLLSEAIIAGISFNSKYLRAGWAGNLSGQAIFIVMLLSALIFFLGFLYYSIIKTKFTTRRPIVFSIALSSVFFGAILGTFYNHYYLIIIPYLSLLTAIFWREVIRSKVLILLCIIGIVGSYAISTKQLYNSFWGSAHIEAQQMKDAANYVSQNTDTTDTIIYQGYGATFYQLAKRDSGSRFISASHPLIDERENFGYGFTDLHISDIESLMPKYFIVNLTTKDLYSENQRLQDYIDSHYTIEESLPGYEILRRIN